MTYKKCPKCGTKITLREKRMDGGFKCRECGYKESQNKLSSFSKNEE